MINIEAELERLPDLVADELLKWRKSTLEREQIEALLYAQFKGEDKERSATEIKAMIQSNGDRYNAVLREITAESEYTRLMERLMSVKKAASFRTAF